MNSLLFELTFIYAIPNHNLIVWYTRSVWHVNEIVNSKEVKYLIAFQKFDTQFLSHSLEALGFIRYHIKFNHSRDNLSSNNITSIPISNIR